MLAIFQAFIISFEVTTVLRYRYIRYKMYIIKKFKTKKEVGITIKRKETRSKLEMAITHQIVLITVSWNIKAICSQMHVQKEYSLAYLQHLIPGIKEWANTPTQNRD